MVSAKEMAAQLRKMGHTVEIARDGPTALQVEPIFKPDIVILTFDLPGMDAITVARAIRAQANRDVMLVGDRGSDEDYARADQAGCFDSFIHRLKSMVFIRYGPVTRKLANRSPEDWVRDALHSCLKDDLPRRMLEAAAEQFDPAELAPLIPGELLSEVRGFAEFQTDLRNYLATFNLKLTNFDEFWEDVLKGASRWFRFFNP